MSGRRGRPTNKKINSNYFFGDSQSSSRPRTELKKINTDTLSVHSIDSGDDDNILDRPPTTNSSCLVKPAQKQSKQRQNPKPLQTDGNDLSHLLHSIKADTAATRTDIQATRRELKSDINKLAQQSKSKFDAIDDRLAKTTQDIKVLFSKVKAMESKPQLATVDAEVQKQNQLKNNIAISNVMSEPNENLFDIIASILHSIGCANFTVDELVYAKRIPRSKSNLIIAKFRDEARKIEVMKKKADYSIMTADLFKLDEGDANQRIYINTHLTPFFSNLSYHGRMAIHKNQIHSCWVSSRGFLVRLDENSTPVPIADASKLEAFIASNKRSSTKKRVRSVDADPSPSSSRPSKLKHRSDPNSLIDAAKSLNLSTESHSTENGKNGHIDSN